MTMTTLTTSLAGLLSMWRSNKNEKCVRKNEKGVRKKENGVRQSLNFLIFSGYNLNRRIFFVTLQ